MQIIQKVVYFHIALWLTSIVLQRGLHIFITWHTHNTWLLTDTLIRLRNLATLNRLLVLFSFTILSARNCQSISLVYLVHLAFLSHNKAVHLASLSHCSQSVQTFWAERSSDVTLTETERVESSLTLHWSFEIVDESLAWKFQVKTFCQPMITYKSSRGVSYIFIVLAK